MIYQVDFKSTASGKKVSMTKRHVSWRWGVANENALSEGKVGVECRGYEHEISLVWSITSGKRKLLENGKEIHFSVGRRAGGKFQHSWNAFNNHVFTVVAHASPPLKAIPGFKQFDLLIDGMSFHSLPRIFELSRNNQYSQRFESRLPLAQPRHTFGSSERREMMTKEESFGSYAEMKFAERVHDRQGTPEVNLATEQTNQQPFFSQAKPKELSAPQPVSLLDMELEHPSTPSLDSTVWSSDNFGYCSSGDCNFNPNQPPPYEAVYSSIMNAYDSTYNNTENIHPQSDEIMPDISNLHIDSSLSYDKDDKQSSLESPKDVISYDSALENLVNLDDISSSVFKSYTPDKTFDMNEKQNNTKSLAELKSMHNARSSSAPTKDIMKNHQAYSTDNPGAVVVYGQSPQHSFNNYVYNPAPLYYGSTYY